MAHVLLFSAYPKVMQPEVSRQSFAQFVKLPAWHGWDRNMGRLR